MAVFFNGTQVSTLNFGGTIGSGTNPAIQSQTFDTSGTFTVPANVRQIFVICTGGGSGANYDGEYFTGGAGSGRKFGIFHVTPSAQYTVTIGAGGAKGSTTSTGGTTSFGGLLSCTGGYSNSGILTYGGEGITFFPQSTGGYIKELGVFSGLTGVYASASYSRAAVTAGSVGGFGLSTTSLIANTGSGGVVINVGSDGTVGSAGKCVVYWFTYS